MKLRIPVAGLLATLFVGALGQLPESHAGVIEDVREGPYPDGSYYFRYATENGILREETATPTEDGTLVVVGSYAYTAPDGQVIETEYIADGNGYRAFPASRKMISQGISRRPQTQQVSVARDPAPARRPVPVTGLLQRPTAPVNVRNPPQQVSGVSRPQPVQNTFVGGRPLPVQSGFVPNSVQMNQPAQFVSRPQPAIPPSRSPLRRMPQRIMNNMNNRRTPMNNLVQVAPVQQSRPNRIFGERIPQSSFVRTQDTFESNKSSQQMFQSSSRFQSNRNQASFQTLQDDYDESSEMMDKGHRGEYGNSDMAYGY